MSFERKYRSEQGAAEINKIYDFLMGLIIKNNYEANAAATSESLSEYFNYYNAYSNLDTFSDYDTSSRAKYTDAVFEYMSSLKGRSYTVTLGTIQSLNSSRNESLLKGYSDKKELYIDYLNGLRRSRVYYYDERNPYYRQFMGLPDKKSDWIWVNNLDASEDGYVKITDLTEEPDSTKIYYTKIDGKYIELGYLSSWYDEETFELIADNFYILEVVAIHKVKSSSFPNTYAYYIQQRNIDFLIEKYPDLTYLRFIGKNYTAFYLHELPNYSILQYENGILTNIEQEYFFKAYNKARQQVIADYIEGFDKRQPLYNLLMIENLLYFTVINYTNSYIEKYSVGIYSEKNLDDILNSHGYSKLTKISSYELKNRVVRNLNDLITNKGNNHILELILDRIIQDDNSVLKRYYLEKQYNTNNDGSIKIDTSKGLENSINLVFREVPAVELDNATNEEETYREYDELIDNDELWGGLTDDDTEAMRNTKRTKLKKQLLALNFNSILTRYISLISTVDIMDSQTTLRDMLYLMFKYIDMTDMHDFFTKSVNIDTTSASAAAMFAAICWLQQMKTYKDPDTIIKNNIVINDSAIFRKFGKLAVDRQSFENVVIYNGSPITKYDISPEIANWRITEFLEENREDFKDFFANSGVESERIETVRIKDVILQPEYKQTDKNTWTLTKPKITADGYKNLVDTEETIDDSMPIYRFYSNGIQLGEVTADTTFADLIEDYNTQMPNLFTRITQKLAESYDFNLYQAWLYLQQQARKNNSIYFIFKEYNKFSDFISEYCEGDSFIEWLGVQLKVPITNGYTKPAMSDICNTIEVISKTFQTWVNDNISSEIYKNSNITGNVSYIDDMRILFNEFLSVYSELYSVDFKYTLGDREKTDYCINLYYNPLETIFTQNVRDLLELNEKLASTIVAYLNDEEENDEDTLKLIYELYDKCVLNLQDNINNELIYNEKTNEYIPEDQFVYEYDSKIRDLINDWYGITDKFIKIHNQVSYESQIPTFHGILKITSNEKGVKYYDD